MIHRALVGALAALCFPAVALAQSPSAFPVDVAATTPHPVAAEGRQRLLYELRLTNFSPRVVRLTGVDVFGAGGAPLASYRGDAVKALLAAVGPEDEGGDLQAIGGGRTIVIFLDLWLPAGAHPPASLRHRLSLSAMGGGGATIERTVDIAPVTVAAAAAPVLRAPLRGAGWVAANGLSNPNHRRSWTPVDGKVGIAQRFAIDWVQLGPDGRIFHGDSKSNENFPGYGAEVLAVADARVSSVQDGLPQNAGSNQLAGRAVTLQNIAGNHVILDLGGGRFALYAHLQPGSLRVKVGDRVKAGQVLGLLGNSGNSDAPHLHFQLMDANSPLGAEGLPYVLESFTQAGAVDRPEVIDAGEAWRPAANAAAAVHRREFPVDNAVVPFP